MFGFLKCVARSLSRSAQTRRPVRQARPGVEPLEDRQCASVSVGVSTGNTLSVLGDENANHVYLHRADATAANPKPKLYLEVLGQTVVNPVTNVPGGGFSDIEYVNVLLKGNTDSLEADFGSQSTGKLNLFADLGPGIDTARVSFSGQLTGTAALRFYVDGGDDMDILTTTFYMPPGNASSATSLEIFVRGGSGNDTMLSTFTGGVGHLNLRMYGGAGDDTVDARVTANSGAVYVDAVVDGGSDWDTMSFYLFQDPGATLHIDQALLDFGLDGGTPAGKTANVKAINQYAFLQGPVFRGFIF